MRNISLPVSVFFPNPFSPFLGKYTSYINMHIHSFLSLKNYLFIPPYFLNSIIFFALCIFLLSPIQQITMRYSQYETIAIRRFSRYTGDGKWSHLPYRSHLNVTFNNPQGYRHYLLIKVSWKGQDLVCVNFIL